eukprot:1161593-Pelagomonas_calceolata.AAC.6
MHAHRLIWHCAREKAEQLHTGTPASLGSAPIENAEQRPRLRVHACWHQSAHSEADANACQCTGELKALGKGSRHGFALPNGGGLA